MTLIEKAIEIPSTPAYEFRDLLKELNDTELISVKNELIKKQKEGCKVACKLKFIRAEQKRREKERLEKAGKTVEAKKLAKAEDILRLMREKEQKEDSILKHPLKNIKIGDKVERKLSIDAFSNDTGKRGKKRLGVVKEIHKYGWWYMVEFQLQGGKIRECYQM